MQRMCVHHLIPFHEPVVNLKELLIFHNGASFRFQRSAMVIHGMNACDACKFEYVTGSSLAVIQGIRHRPCPLVGTYHHDSDPSDLIACKHSSSSKLEYKRVGIHRQLPCQ